MKSIRSVFWLVIPSVLLACQPATRVHMALQSTIPLPTVTQTATPVPTATLTAMPTNSPTPLPLSPTVKSTGSVEGTLTHADGKPAIDQELYLSDLVAGGRLAETETDEQGHFSFERLAAGYYLICYPTKNDLGMCTDPVMVEAGITTQMDLVMP